MSVAQAHSARPRSVPPRPVVSSRHRITIRAMVTPCDGSYIAECIDLNLMVRRETPEAAMGALETAIHGYIGTVLDDQDAIRQLEETGSVAGLLPRPSPLERRMKYHCLCLLAAIFYGNRRDFHLREYTSFQFAPSQESH